MLLHTECALPLRCICAACALPVRCICATACALCTARTRGRLYAARNACAPRLQVITPTVRPWVLLCFPGDRVALEAADEP